jgi:hypothetical protein
MLNEMAVHGGEIFELLGKLNGIKSLTSSLSLFNEYLFKASTLDNGYSQTTLQMTPGQINLQVSGDENTLYGQLSIGGGTSESGITSMSDNPINLMTRDNKHYIEITKDINYISDVNGFVIVPSPSSKPAGVRIKSFD